MDLGLLALGDMAGNKTDKNLSSWSLYYIIVEVIF